MQIRIEKIVYPGRRLGLLEGKVVFTDRGLPGETVEVELFKDRRSYAEARTLRIVEPSPARVEPRCAHFLACSPYQDMDYGLEVEIKRTQVAEILSRELKRPFANLTLTPSPEVWGYRNKIGLRVLQRGRRGPLRLSRTRRAGLVRRRRPVPPRPGPDERSARTHHRARRTASRWRPSTASRSGRAGRAASRSSSATWPRRPRRRRWPRP